MKRISVIYGAFFVSLCACYVSSLEDFNVTEGSKLLPVVIDGQTLYMTQELMERLEHERETWHWLPWIRIRLEYVDNIAREIVPRDSIDSFPDGILTDDQLRKGGFLLYVLFGIYAFTLLAVVCNDFFIPCVELICEDLKIPQNVAAATFMAVATSCPEFFVNVISTFLTQSDMGIGTIVGSAIFNALGVAAIGGLAAIRITFLGTLLATSLLLLILDYADELDYDDENFCIRFIFGFQKYDHISEFRKKLKWFLTDFKKRRRYSIRRPIAIGMRPVTRDVLIYMINVSVLVALVWDGQINLFEAVVLGVMYVLYFVFMFNSMRLFRLYDRLVARCSNKGTSDTDIVVVASNGVEEGIDNKGFNEGPITVRPISNSEKIPQGPDKAEPTEPKPKKSIFAYPKHKSALYQLGWLYLWPVKLILGFTIPSPVYHRRWYPLSFVMCIVWIGVNSYFVSWSMTVIGFVFFIPDSVMGMTFLAFGGCLPEAFSIFIMSRRGEGGIGVSNALGANSLAILFALGLPWLIKILTNIAQGVEHTEVLINSAGIGFVIGSILVAVSCLWLTLLVSKFTLRKTVGVILAVLYVIFITFAVLVETGVILCQIEGC